MSSSSSRDNGSPAMSAAIKLDRTSSRGLAMWSVDGALEVLVDLVRRRCRRLAVFFEATRSLRADHVVLPREELVKVFEWKSEQLEEHRARQWDREFLVEVAPAAVGEAVDDLVHQRADGRFARGHLPRREERVEDAAVLRVVGRVDLQRDQRPHIAEVDGIHVRREHVGALERHLDVREATENHGSFRSRPEHRGRLAQHLVHRLGFCHTRHRLVDITFGICHSDSLAPTSEPAADLCHIA